jgi:hypothetical protein
MICGFIPVARDEICNKEIARYSQVKYHRKFMNGLSQQKKTANVWL